MVNKTSHTFTDDRIGRLAARDFSDDVPFELGKLRYSRGWTDLQYFEAQLKVRRVIEEAERVITDYNLRADKTWGDLTADVYMSQQIRGCLATLSQRGGE